VNTNEAKRGNPGLTGAGGLVCDSSGA